MKISNEKFVALSYTLTVDGEVVESIDKSNALPFVFGSGQLLPSFEAEIEGKEAGEEFSFTLTPEQAYGEFIEDAVAELPKSLFQVDGVVNQEILFEGSQLPMMDNDGNRLIGIIKKVSDDTVTMDFNHPMAGKTLNFVGAIVEVREATEDELNPSGCGCGCSSGGGCGDGCSDDDCGSGGCCH